MASTLNYGVPIHMSVGCQNITARNQSLREERSSIGTQHSNILFKYQVGASTPVAEHEPRHMEALQYRLNCQEAHLGSKCLHLLGPDACIIGAPMPSSTLHQSAQQEASDAYIFMCKSTVQDARV